MNISPELTVEVEALEFRFPWSTEKAKEFKDAKHTIVRLNEVEHTLQFRIVNLLLQTRGVQESGLLFPSMPVGGTLGDKARSVSISQTSMRKYLRKVEDEAHVQSIPKRAYHGLKRLAVTRCESEEEMELIRRLSNTSREMVMSYHKRLGTFENQSTLKAQEESLRERLIQERIERGTR